jgi:hypothetical protein
MLSQEFGACVVEGEGDMPLPGDAVRAVCGGGVRRARGLAVGRKPPCRGNEPNVKGFATTRRSAGLCVSPHTTRAQCAPLRQSARSAAVRVCGG